MFKKEDYLSYLSQILKTENEMITLLESLLKEAGDNRLQDQLASIIATKERHIELIKTMMSKFV